MNEILNPYIAGAPVVENSMFFGREDIFNWIERSLSGKFTDHILVLHGQRRVGKTSVLKQIPNYLPKNFIQVFFDLQGRTSTTLERFLWWMASEIVRTLRKERGILLPKPDQKSFEDPDYLINSFIPSLRSELGSQVLLLTFDEFDSLDRPEIRKTLASPLIDYLRRLIEIDGLNFIFSIGSSGDKLENMQASYTDFFKSALYRKISFLTGEDCQRLITRPVEGVIHYDRKAVDQIFKITSGHPYFTQLMCHELFSLCQKTGSRQISSQDVENILGDVIERGTVNLKFVWDEASDLEKWVLAALAQMDGSTVQQLTQTLNAQRVRFSEPDLNSAVIHLQDKDVLTKDLRFVIHLMRLWLVSNRPMDRVREELVEVNPIANRYMEIGDEYRDRGQVPAALESYQQALQIAPDNLRALLSTAGLYLEQKDYPQAAEAFELALKINDEDVAARAGYCEAKLALGDAAQSSSEISEAISLYQSILVINPAHSEARQRLAAIYRERAEKSLSNGQDDEALQAFNQALMFTPDDEGLSTRYDAVLGEKKSKVIRGWLDRAEEAAKNKKWTEVIQACEAYLSLNQSDDDGVQAKLEHARKYAQLDADYEEAQKAIRNKGYERAIELLQGIIAQDPGYKSTPRLLSEAVQAKKTKDPVWRKPWFFGLLAAVVILALGVIFGPQAWNAISAALADRQPSSNELSTTKTPKYSVSMGAGPTPYPSSVLDFFDWMRTIADTAPSFIEDFAIPQTYWSQMIADYVSSEGSLHVIDEPSEQNSYEYNIPWTAPEDFILQFDFTPFNFPFGSNLVVYFRSSVSSSYDFRIGSNGEWNLWFNKEPLGLELDSGTIADLNPNHMYLFRIFAWQEKIAIAIDGVVIAYIEDGFSSAGEISIHAETYKPIDISIDNIQLWDLSGIGYLEHPNRDQAQDFYQPVREYLAVTPPTFQEDFETPQPYWEEMQVDFSDTKPVSLSKLVSDGLLHLNSIEEDGDAGNFGLYFPEIQGRAIAIQFDFQFTDPRNSGTGLTASIVTSSTSANKEGYSPFCDFWIYEGTTSCDLYKLSEGSDLVHLSTWDRPIPYFDEFSPHTMFVVFYGGQFASFLDGYFVAFADGVELIDHTISINIGTDVSPKKFDATIDNIKFWNLEGTVLRSEEDILNEAEKIWNSIGEVSHEGDDFEEPRGYWNQMQVAFSDTKSVPLSELVADGRLQLDAIENEDYGYFRLPFPGLQGSSSFALQYEFQFTDPGNSGSILTTAIEAWGTSRTQEGYSSYCDFYPDEEQLMCGLYKLTEGRDLIQLETWNRVIPFPDIEAPHTMFVFFYGTQFFCFFDGELVAYSDGLQVFDRTISINVGQNIPLKKFNALIDNIEFWNLDGVEFN